MEQIFILKEPIGKIKEAGDIFNKIKRFKIDFNRENFIIFFLNNSNKIIYKEITFIGGIDCCLISPEVIFKKAILKNSSKLIIAHNHPSSNLTPSYEDEEVFKKLKEMGKILNISILDSIIFNKKEFFSLEGVK